MSPPDSSNVTRLLHALENGRPGAADELVPLVYEHLHLIARSAMRREVAGHTLQPTALLHEAFLVLVDQRTANWQNRSHFFAIAATVMRRILLDHARRRNAAKRGPSRRRAASFQPTGETQEVTASVTNSSNTGVTWSASSGTVSVNGNAAVYSPPAEGGTHGSR